MTEKAIGKLIVIASKSKKEQQHFAVAIVGRLITKRGAIETNLALLLQYCKKF